MSIFTTVIDDVEKFFSADAWPFIKNLLLTIEGVAVPIVEADAQTDAVTAVTSLAAGSSPSAVAAQAGASILAQGVALGQKIAATTAGVITEGDAPATTSTAG